MCSRYNLRHILLYWSTLNINVKAPRLSNETTLINNIDMDSSRQQPIAHLTSAHAYVAEKVLMEICQFINRYY